MTEEDLGYHVQLDFTTTVFGLPFGAMSACVTSRHDLSIHRPASRSPAKTFAVHRVNRKYDDTLPAVNLVLEPFQDFLVRGSYWKVMSRPPLGIAFARRQHWWFLDAADGDVWQSRPRAVPCGLL